VMRIDVEVAVDSDRQVKDAVPREGIQKMIDEPDAGLDVRAPATVNRHVHRYHGFSRLPLELTTPWPGGCRIGRRH